MERRAPLHRRSPFPQRFHRLPDPRWQARARAFAVKALPLIDTADLDKHLAAYDAFELVLSAILRAALVHVPDEQRRNHNRELFERFVIERNPARRGHGDEAYANALWEFRNAAAWSAQDTGPAELRSGSPTKASPTMGDTNVREPPHSRIGKWRRWPHKVARRTRRRATRAAPPPHALSRMRLSDGERVPQGVR